jgi:hypothetical protein
MILLTTNIVAKRKLRTQPIAPLSSRRAIACRPTSVIVISPVALPAGVAGVGLRQKVRYGEPVAERFQRCPVCSIELPVDRKAKPETFAIPTVHQLLPGSKTKLADLHLLCANCHRMIHARRPWLTLDHKTLYFTVVICAELIMGIKSDAFRG